MKEEFKDYRQYVRWIAGHAITDWQLRGKPVWRRWASWHRRHRKSIAILAINYGHPHSPEAAIGYFFA
jgi:hypothetical protein